MGRDLERSSRRGVGSEPWGEADEILIPEDLFEIKARDSTVPNRDKTPIAGNGVWRAWTDGSCVRSQNGPGGWAAILIGPAGQRRELSGSEPRTTNNKMELSAILAAVRAVPKGASITVTSDSEYAVRVSSRRYKAKKNRNLVQAIWCAAESRRVEYQWVRGHAGHVMNERADQLANAARLRQRR